MSRSDHSAIVDRAKILKLLEDSERQVFEQRAQDAEAARDAARFEMRELRAVVAEALDRALRAGRPIKDLMDIADHCRIRCPDAEPEGTERALQQARFLAADPMFTTRLVG